MHGILIFRDYFCLQPEGELSVTVELNVPEGQNRSRIFGYGQTTASHG